MFGGRTPIIVDVTASLREADITALWRTTYDVPAPSGIVEESELFGILWLAIYSNRAPIVTVAPGSIPIRGDWFSELTTRRSAE